MYRIYKQHPLIFYIPIIFPFYGKQNKNQALLYETIPHPCFR